MPMARTRRPLGPVLAALVVFGAVAGCDYFAPVPAYQLDLPGTAWRVVAVDGAPLLASQPATVTFNRGDAVEVRTGCRVMVLVWASDTDGAALSFGPEPAEDLSWCAADLANQDGVVIDALRSVESWSVRDQSHITLHGDVPLDLVRVNAYG